MKLSHESTWGEKAVSQGERSPPLDTAQLDGDGLFQTSSAMHCYFYSSLKLQASTHLQLLCRAAVSAQPRVTYFP